MPFNKGSKNPKFIHGDKGTKFYNIWLSMKQRCVYFGNNHYDSYKEKRIMYDSKWENYLIFKKDMYFKYIWAKRKFGKLCRLSLERINNKLGYFFENCIFIPLSEQGKNRSTNRWFIAISPNGEKFKSNNQTEFAKQHGLHQGHIGDCLLGKYKHHKHWTFKLMEENNGNI